MKGQRKSCKDEIDQLCELWSHQRRIALGIVISDRIEPNERLGKLRSTLGRIKTDAEGAGATGVNAQQFPEVYRGDGLLIHRIYTIMPGDHRMVMHLHYVWREIPIRYKAPEVPTTVDGFWGIVAKVKSFIQGCVSYNTYHQRVRMSHAHQ